MQINNHYEPEIRLKDVFFEILYHWRSILIAAIVGALLLGGYQYYSIWSIHNKGLKTDEEQQYEYAMKDYELNLNTSKEALRVNRTLLQQIQDYMTKSVLYNMDASSLMREERTFAVTLKQEGNAIPANSFQDPVDYVMASYSNSLFNGVDPDKMLALLGTNEKRYMSELVRIGVNTDTNIMTIVIYGDSQEKLKEIGAYFMNHLLTVCAKPIQALYPHELVMISNTINLGPSDSVQQTWSKNATDMANYKEAISEAEAAIYDLEKQGDPVMPGKHIGRMAAIGFVVFAFLTVLLWSVRYLTGGRLHDGKEMTQRYGLFVYAEADHSRARRPGKGIDALIEKWEFGKKRVGVDQACHQATTLLAGAVSCSTLVLVGTRASKGFDQLKKTLEANLKGDARQIVAVADFLQSEQAGRLPEGADLLIVEEKYESRTDQIQREAEILSMQRANVLGSVIL
jgi:hypothetical protein